MTDVTGTRNTKQGRETAKSAPAAMRTRVKSRETRGSYVRPDENTQLSGVSGAKMKSPSEKFNSQHRNRTQAGMQHQPHPETTQLLTEASGYHRLDINIPTAQHQSMSGLSSANCRSDYSHSDSRESIHSSQTEEYGTPEPPPLPPPEEETTQCMRNRVHQNLLQTLTDTEQFLVAMEQKRKNRKPQIVYSDEENDIPEPTPAPATELEEPPAIDPQGESASSEAKAVVVTNHPLQSDSDRFLKIVYDMERDIERDDSDASHALTQDELSESDYDCNESLK